MSWFVVEYRMDRKKTQRRRYRFLTVLGKGRIRRKGNWRQRHSRLGSVADEGHDDPGKNNKMSSRSKKKKGLLQVHDRRTKEDEEDFTRTAPRPGSRYVPSLNTCWVAIMTPVLRTLRTVSLSTDVRTESFHTKYLPSRPHGIPKR